MGRRNRRNCYPRPIDPVEPINVECSCIANINGINYLLMDIASTIPNVEFESIAAIRLTDTEANRLIRAGVNRCTVISEQQFVAMARPNVIFRSIIVINGQAFRLYSNAENCFILVQTTLVTTTSVS